MKLDNYRVAHWLIPRSVLCIIHSFWFVYLVVQFLQRLVSLVCLPSKLSGTV